MATTPARDMRMYFFDFFAYKVSLLVNKGTCECVCNACMTGMPLLTRAFFALLCNTIRTGEIVCSECADIYVGMCAPVCIVKCVGYLGVEITQA